MNNFTFIGRGLGVQSGFVEHTASIHGKLREIDGAPGGIRERALLAMRIASEAGSRRRIPTRGRSTTYTQVTGVWRRMAAYGGVERHIAAHKTALNTGYGTPATLNSGWVGSRSEHLRSPPGSVRARLGCSTPCWKRAEAIFGVATRIGPNGINQPGRPRCH
jgi:hypothetical protein